jgi:hypothetical protein
MPESISILLSMLTVGLLIFVVIRAFRRGYAGWGWGLLSLIVIVPVSLEFLPDDIAESILYRIFTLGLLVGLPILVFFLSRLPSTDPVPCKECDGEAIALRKVTLDLDNDQLIPSRISMLILLILGGAISLFGIRLFFFALANEMLNIGVLVVPGVGFSLVGSSFKDLTNRPENIGPGFLYKCKECKKRFSQKIENL